MTSTPPLWTGLDVRAPRRLRAALCSSVRDLQGPPAATATFRRRAPRRFRLQIGELVVDGTAAACMHEALIEHSRQVSAAAARAHIVLAGSAVARAERAVVLAGHTGSGATTLAAAALQRGWTFLSDDVVVVAPDTASVVPFHRPLGLRADRARMLGLAVVRDRWPKASAAPLPASTFAELAPATNLGALVVLERDDQSPAAPELTSLSPAEALARLTTLTLAAGGHEVRMFRELHGLVETTDAFVLRYRDAIEAAALLGSALA